MALDGYTHFLPFTVTANSALAAGHQLKLITIYKNTPAQSSNLTHCKDDFSNVRFALTDDTLLPYHFVDMIPGYKAICCVRMSASQAAAAAVDVNVWEGHPTDTDGQNPASCYDAWRPCTGTASTDFAAATSLAALTSWSYRRQNLLYPAGRSYDAGVGNYLPASTYAPQTEPKAVHYTNGSTIKRTFFVWWGMVTGSSVGTYFVRYFDHVTQLLSDIRINIASASNGDPHKAPCLYIDHNKKLVLIYNCDGDATNNRSIRCNNAVDHATLPIGSTVSDWTAITVTGITGLLYPRPIKLSTTNHIGLLYLYSPTNNDHQFYWRKSTDNGSTWGSATVITAFTTGDWCQPFMVSYSGGVIRVAFSKFTYSTSALRDVYYMESADDGATWRKSDGSTAYTLPFNNAAAEKIVDSSTDTCQVYDIIRTASSSTLILYSQGTGTTFKLKQARLASGTWTISELGTDLLDHTSDNSIYYRNASGDIRIVAPTTESVADSNGGNLDEWQSTDDGVTWTKTKAITSGLTTTVDVLPSKVYDAGADGLCEFVWSRGSVSSTSVEGQFFFSGGAVPVAREISDLRDHLTIQFGATLGGLIEKNTTGGDYRIRARVTTSGVNGFMGSRCNLAGTTRAAARARNSTPASDWSFIRNGSSDGSATGTASSIDGWHFWELQQIGAAFQFYVDDVAVITTTQTTFNTNVPTGQIVGFFAQSSVLMNATEIALMKAVTTEPTISWGAESEVGSIGLVTEPEITLSTNALNPSCLQGANPSNGSFTIDNTGVETMAYTVTKSAAWLSVSPDTGTSSGEADTITVTYAASGLSPGVYTDTIIIASPTASNSPRTVYVTLTVYAVNPLTLTPSTLNPVCGAGRDAVAQQVTLANRSTSSVNYSIADNQTWLSVAPTSGTLAAGESVAITVTYDTDALSAGQYSATITASGDGGETPQTVAVTLDVIATTRIGLSVASLLPVCDEGSDASPASFQVFNVGTGTLSYSISDDAAWLSLEPSSGASTGEADTVTVTYDTDGLAAGTYTATITVTDAGADNSPQTIAVNLTVRAAATGGGTPQTLHVTCVVGTDATTRHFSIANAIGGTMEYDITVDEAWLSVSPDNGTSTGEADTIDVIFDTNALAVGEHTATITIDATPADNSPQEINVILTVLPSGGTCNLLSGGSMRFGGILSGGMM